MDRKQNTATPAMPRLLPADYYLCHFGQVIEGVRSRYGFLLKPDEISYLAKLDELTLPGKMLFARMVNRRGPCFRVDRLNYPEIGPSDQPLRELTEAGFLELCRHHSPSGDTTEMLRCFTRAEIMFALRDHRVPKCARKDALLAWLAAWDEGAAWFRSFLAENPVIRIADRHRWPFLRFLFFGELRDNLADFVARALGHVVTESIDPGHLRPHFSDRRQADDAYRMATLYVEFRRIRSNRTALETFEWWQVLGIERGQLTAGEAWFDRLVDRLGQLLERDRQFDAALALYETSPSAPSRERRVRILLKRGTFAEARALLEAILAAPCHRDEAYAARQMLARMDKTSKRSEARHYQYESRTVCLEYPDGGVEASVLAHYRSLGWRGAHSENWLWNASFGLLLWDIIYDPRIGVFHSPLQLAPSDLYDRNFYARRQSAIEQRLEILARPDQAFEDVMATYKSKNGVSNPFVDWRDEIPDLIAIMLRLLPPQGHAAALRHLAQDVKHHARGLPDLFLWTDDDYRFAEIKAEGDHLSGHQYEWLRVLRAAGINVSLEKIVRNDYFCSEMACQMP